MNAKVRSWSTDRDRDTEDRALLGSPLPWEAGCEVEVVGRGAIGFCVFPVYSFIFCGVYAKFMAYL